jgi:hypothetical protein
MLLRQPRLCHNRIYPNDKRRQAVPGKSPTMGQALVVAILGNGALGAAHATEAVKSAAVTLPTLRGGYCFSNHAKISDTEVVWRCEHIGDVPLRQIYEKGFRVVGMYRADPMEKIYGFQFLIIEEQRR